MNVETYECSETAAEPIEACEEAVQIMEKLELTGQQSLISTNDDAPVARCPYRAMKREEEFVFGVLCPKKVSLANYSAGPLPLRVLQIAAHATDLGIYYGLEVWYVAEQPDPDPVLIGLIGSSSWNISARHILARWGDELESWPVLVKRAMEAKRVQVADAFSVLARRLQMATDNNELTAEELIEKGADWKPELSL